VWLLPALLVIAAEASRRQPGQSVWQGNVAQLSQALLSRARSCGWQARAAQAVAVTGTDGAFRLAPIPAGQYA